MIIITGDSWGCGEWEHTEFDYRPSHPGLEYYIKNQGKKVLNMSLPSASNGLVKNTLEILLRTIRQNSECFSEPVESILIFKTEWSRDFDLDSIRPGDEMIHICKWYYSLSELAQEYNVRIGIIGGLADTLNIDKFEVEYPGLFVACQSLTNLLIHNDPVLKEPVYTVDFDEKLLQYIKSINDDTSLDYFLSIVSNGLERYKIFKKHKNWFWPDGVHPNRHGHKKLYDYLVSKNIL